MPTPAASASDEPTATGRRPSQIARQADQLGQRVVVADAARDLVRDEQRHAQQGQPQAERRTRRRVEVVAAIDGTGREQLEVELAEMISSAIKCARKVRLVTSGTEAGLTALRLARAATGRSNIIKFDGCYHGHSDSMLVRAGSGALTFGQPDSAGVPAALAAMTMVARYNSIESVESLFRAAPEKIAAVIVEPVAANMGVVNPDAGSLKALAEIAHDNGALLICDEVITGFRLCFGSIAESMGIAPDLMMLGKIIGGGMPVAAVAGPAKIMDLLAPLGPVYQAGTLSGNPLSVRSGLETLCILKETNPYTSLDVAGARLEAGLRDPEPGGIVRDYPGTALVLLDSLVPSELGAPCLGQAGVGLRALVSPPIVGALRLVEDP